MFFCFVFFQCCWQVHCVPKPADVSLYHLPSLFWGNPRQCWEAGGNFCKNKASKKLFVISGRKLNCNITCLFCFNYYTKLFVWYSHFLPFTSLRSVQHVGISVFGRISQCCIEICRPATYYWVGPSTFQVAWLPRPSGCWSCLGFRASVLAPSSTISAFTRFQPSCRRGRMNRQRSSEIWKRWGGDWSCLVTAGSTLQFISLK